MPLADEHIARQRRIVAQVDLITAAAWRQLDAGDLTGSWSAQVGPQVVKATTTGMLVAAQGAQTYVTESVKAAGDRPTPAGALRPAAFAETASDGRPLASLLYLPVITTKTRLGAGQSLPDALASGLATLQQLASTQVLDAGRVATGVALTADTTAVGWVRELRGSANCSRCVILAGRVYRWSHGFARHPRCDCQHRILSRSEWDQHDTSIADDPAKAFRAMTVQQQDKAFTKAGAAVIRDGADMGRVVNARRGMYEAGSRRLTTEGTTNRGKLGVDTPSGRARLMPEQIYKDATDRPDAIRLLKLHGYITT